MPSLRLNFGFSVDPVDGHYFTVDPTFNFDTFPATKPDFKKTKKSSTKSTKENVAADLEPDDFVRKIKQINLYKYRDFDKKFYRQTISDTLALCEDELIVPYVSQTFGLFEINDAIDYIRSKKCTGKVLIDILKPQTNSEPATSSKNESEKQGVDD